MYPSLYLLGSRGVRRARVYDFELVCLCVSVARGVRARVSEGFARSEGDGTGRRARGGAADTTREGREADLTVTARLRLSLYLYLVGAWWCEF